MVATILLIGITVAAVSVVAAFVVRLGTPERTLFASISIDGASDGSTRLVLLHGGGDAIGAAFTSTDWANMEVRINGVVATGTKTLNGSAVTGTPHFELGDVLVLTVPSLSPSAIITVLYKPAGQTLVEKKLPGGSATTSSSTTTTTTTTHPPLPPPPSLKYDWETSGDNGGWRVEDGITVVAQTTDKAENGSGSLQCTASISPTASENIGATCVYIPMDLKDKTISVWIYFPSEARGISAYIFLQDSDWNSYKSAQYQFLSGGHNERNTGEWVQLTWDISGVSGLDNVKRVGVMIAGWWFTLDEPWSGYFWIDAFNWS